MTHEPTNADRAAWARQALNVFAETTFCGRSFDQLLRDQGPGEDTDARAALGDLIVNLHHLADAMGWPTDRLGSAALQCFQEEVAEEAEAGA